MKRIVALIDLMTVEQDQQFIDFLTSKGWGYWHWIDGAWLINTDNHEQNVPTQIRDRVKAIAPGKHCMVFEVTDIGAWAGFGPNTAKSNMFQWIRDEWKV